MRVKTSFLIVVGFLILITGSAFAQYGPYGVTDLGLISVNSSSPLISLSREVSNAPGGLDNYLANLRGLPTGAGDDFLAAFDLVGGGRRYSIDVSNLNFACSSIRVYKVNRDATVGVFPNVECVDGVLFIQHNASNATFLLLGP